MSISDSQKPTNGSGRQWLTLSHSGGIASLIWSFFEDPDSGWGAFIWRRIVYCLIITSVWIELLQTLPSPPLAEDVAFGIMVSCDALFTVEFILRALSSPSPGGFARSPWNLLDTINVAALVLRIMSFVGIGDDLAKTLLFGFVPVARVLKALQNFPNLRLLFHALSVSASALTIPLFLLMVLGLIFSTLIYLVESREDIISMPHSIYLVVVTLTTVGYGDMVPKTDAGRFLCGMVAMCGVIYMAMPLSIVGNAFSETWRDRGTIILVANTRQRLIQWGYTDSELHELFLLVDADNSGTVDLEEFGDMLRHLGIRITPGSMKALFHYFIKHGSDTMSLEDFRRALKLPKASRFRFFSVAK